MENEKIVLKRKKKTFLSKLFEDKKKKYLYMFIFILPFIIAIVIFGVITVKEVKGIINMAKGDTPVEVKDENKITSMNYILRDNATDLQKEYFAELKNAVEVDNADELTIAGLVCKNFVADFFTWTNKYGQYDVGGLYYFYSQEDDVTNFKSNIYLKARDGIYKYLNQYINEYGSENLLEVSEVSVDSVSKANYVYEMYEKVGVESDAEGTYYNIYDTINYECFDVTCSWSYKEGSKLDTSKFVNKLNFLVIEDRGRYEIVEISENKIDAREITETTETSEEAQD